jgi:hypothetical protein
MNEKEQKNVELAIDGLCENLVWTWAYYRALFALHEVAKSSPDLLQPYPQFISCLYHGLFDALFLKLYHFLDRSKGASGFPHLFKLLRRYCADDSNLLSQVKLDEKRFAEEINVEKVNKWRNEVVAHLTHRHREPEFFTDNRLHLPEIQGLIAWLEGTVESYSQTVLQRGNDTRYPSEAVAREVAALMKVEMLQHKRRCYMMKNMGAVDRIIRIVLALVVLVLYLTGVISGWLAIVLGILAVIWLLTGIIGFCPAYALFKVSTQKKKKKK